MHDYKARLEAPQNATRRPFSGLRVLALSVVVILTSGIYVALDQQPSAVAQTNDAPATPLTFTLPLPPKGEAPVSDEPDNAHRTARETGEPGQATLELNSEPVTVAGLDRESEAPKDPEVREENPVPAAMPSLPEAPETLEATANPVPVSADRDPPEQITHLSHTVRKGDTLARIFSDMDLSANLLHRIVTSSKLAKRLERIKPGRELRFQIDEAGVLRQLTYQIDPISALVVKPNAESFETELVEQEVEYRTAHAAGTIESSLFNSAQKAGLSDSLTMELANIFGWDIDFALEIRSGDHFSVIYREDWLKGQKLSDGPILAAEFVNQGRVFRAIRFVYESGSADYFTPDGKSVRKAFLRMPVKFARVSSRFSRGRKHPVLNRIRAHRGVDYAASVGTPVRAAGDGRIALRGRKGGYGKTVILEHGGGISTLYAHLSRYARKQRTGTRVKQGQIIGYVGKTGLATGPHLHYEFRKNGVHRNPLKVRLPSAEPIDSRYQVEFRKTAEPLVARLEILTRTLVADAR